MADGRRRTPAAPGNGAARRERRVLLAYLAAVVAATSVHALPALALGLAAVLGLAGAGRRRLAGRAFRAIAPFNGVVSLSYAALALYRGDFSADYLMLLNLRVYLLTCLTFLVAERVNLFRALAFSPTLGYLLTLAYSQAVTFRRVHQDFRQALASRTLAPLGTRDRLRHAAAAGAWLLDKAHTDTVAVTAALRSRGFFDGESP